MILKWCFDYWGLFNITCKVYFIYSSEKIPKNTIRTSYIKGGQNHCVQLRSQNITHPSYSPRCIEYKYATCAENTKALKEITQIIGLYNPSKTGEMMKTDLVNLTNIILCGHGICHSYTYKRGGTGVWQDLWCEHECKVGSKFQAWHESVSDPADLLLSIRKLPPLGMMFK